MPMTPAMEALNPVKFWKSLKTKDADCLFVLQARMVTMVTIKDTMLKTSRPFEILSSILAPHMLTNVAKSVMR